MDNKELYEKFDWSSLKEEHLKSKIIRILEVIPSDVSSIVDIGCGNGAITNSLGKKYDVTAVDRSEHALKYVTTKKVRASADNIPLEDHQYDMVFSSELLEHLPDDILKGTISEFKRLSKKYIFITVPNNENPDKLSIKCPECQYVFNSPNHLRSFTPKSFELLFPEYKIQQTFTFGKQVRYYNPFILKLKRQFTPHSSWIPYFWIPKNKRKTICPHCEHIFTNDYKFNPLATFFDITNVVISPKKSYWLFILLEKK
jgi:ubiquinone/menaquinone biosynthesis C-methylase UbiE